MAEPQSFTFTFTLPGETGLVAISKIYEVAAEGQTPEQRAKMWERYLEFTDPWHKIAVHVSEHIAEWVGRLLDIKPEVKP